MALLSSMSLSPLCRSLPHQFLLYLLYFVPMVPRPLMKQCESNSHGPADVTAPLLLGLPSVLNEERICHSFIISLSLLPGSTNLYF